MWTAIMKDQRAVPTFPVCLIAPWATQSELFVTPPLLIHAMLTKDPTPCAKSHRRSETK